MYKKIGIFFSSILFTAIKKKWSTYKMHTLTKKKSKKKNEIKIWENIYVHATKERKTTVAKNQIKRSQLYQKGEKKKDVYVAQARALANRLYLFFLSFVFIWQRKKGRKKIHEKLSKWVDDWSLKLFKANDRFYVHTS